MSLNVNNTNSCNNYNTNNNNNNNNRDSNSTVISNADSEANNLNGNSCQNSQVPLATTTTLMSNGVNNNYNGINSSNTVIKLQKRAYVIDSILVIILIIAGVCFEFLAQPYERGFFCNDESIRYPYDKETVTVLTLSLVAVLVPLFLMLLIEYLREHQYGASWQKLNNESNTRIPTFVRACLLQFFYYFFGILLVLNVTEIGKFSIGRLRPHFYAVCQPRLWDGTNCTDAINKDRYIVSYYCESAVDHKYTATELRESRLSFPSGHSSAVWYCMLYLVIYLQHRAPVHRFSQFTLHFVQFLLICAAWFVALTRIMDYYHHWGDVLTGSIFGIIGALLATHYIAGFYKGAKGTSTIQPNFNTTPYSLREVSVVTSM